MSRFRSRHRFRIREEESSSTATVVGVVAGALAGFALGVFVAKRLGGIEGIKRRLRRHVAGEDALPATAADGFEDLEDYDDDEIEDDANEDLEARVLEVFRNDPILSERAVDIGSLGESTIELAGWVDTEDEATHAVTLARGVPGVDNVVNRLAIGTEESLFDETARKFADGDPALTEGGWEGRTVGTGRRRQGTSDEPDRHSDPKVELENRWSTTERAVSEAAEEISDVEAAERRRGRKAGIRGDRTGGSPVAPGGVPKADHVANPLEEAP